MPDPAQAAPELSVDERIAQVGNDFLDGLDQNQDPNQTQEEVDAQPEGEEAAPTEEEPTGQPQEEVEALELDGAEYQVPKALAEHVKELQKSGLRTEDYTRKTQELAASRKQNETITLAATQVLQQAQQLAPVFAQLHSMQAHAQGLRSQLTPQLRSEDPIGYNTIQGEYALISQEINQASGYINHAAQQLTEQQMVLRQKLMQEQLPALIKDIPDIQKAEVRDSLASYAADAGLPDDALNYMKFSPPAVRILWKAQQYDKMVKDQAKAKDSLKSKVASVPGVKSTGRAQEPGAQVKQAQAAFRKGGGKLNDGSLDALLKARGI